MPIRRRLTSSAAEDIAISIQRQSARCVRSVTFILKRRHIKMNIVTDNPDTNVSTALNLFFVRNGEAYVRGYGENGEDISLIDFVKRIAIIQAIPILYEISEYLADCLLDNEPESEEGLLALFYTAAWAFAEIRERLKKYEESGLEPEDVKRLKEVAEDA
jgi:hypothetical protein